MFNIVWHSVTEMPKHPFSFRRREGGREAAPKNRVCALRDRLLRHLRQGDAAQAHLVAVLPRLRVLTHDTIIFA
jgi:hypothetical protein